MGKHNSKSGLFLMEMIIVILFFSICSAICINIFATARITADHSNELNNAAVRSTSAAEIFKSAQGDMAITEDRIRSLGEDDILSVTRSEGNTGDIIIVCYDDMVMTIENEGSLAHIEVKSDHPSYRSKADEEGYAQIYSLDVRASEVEA